MNVIIVHGAYGHPEENWFGWLRRELTAQGVDCIVPVLPTPQNQTLTVWLKEFNQQTQDRINEQTILIGHSLGAVFVLRFLQQYRREIAGAILVGTFLHPVGIKQFDEINQSFLVDDYDWFQIRAKAKRIICYHGSNDPYVKMVEFKKLADNLSARRVVIANAGHLNAAAGYTSFPHLLRELCWDNSNSERVMLN